MSPYALTGGRVLGADGGLSAASVVVAGGRIERVQPADAALDGGVATVDCRGCTILPGLIDMHTHLGNPASPFTTGAMDAGIFAPHNAVRAIRAGITTVRDMGGIGGADLRLSRAIAAGVYPGPDMYCSGAHLRVTGGYSTWPDGTGGLSADGPVELRKAARQQLAAGATWIKAFVNGGLGERSADRGSRQFTDEELGAIVDEAGMLGVRVAVHAYSAPAIEASIRAGVGSIEHGNFATEALFDMMLERDVFMIPTYSAYQMVAECGRYSARVAGLSAEVVSEKIGQLALVQRLGDRWGIGSDGGGNMPAELIVDELRFVASRLGLGAAEAIRRATAVNAALLGLTDRGRIAAGLRADLLVVDGNPLESIDDLALLRATIANGRLFDWRVLAPAYGVWEADEALKGKPAWDWQAQRPAA